MLVEQRQHLSNQFTRSSRRYPCPVCNRSKDSDCRFSEDRALVLCHSEINSRVKGDELNSYIWVGETQDGNWGKWIIPNMEPRKNSAYRPTGQEFRFPYTDNQGTVLCTKVRIYQKQPDGSVKKKDWWEPKGVDSKELLPYRCLEALVAVGYPSDRIWQSTQTSPHQAATQWL
jgi:hypothetical protein